MYEDLWQRKVLFTENRLKHVKESHPELEGQLKNIDHTLKDPEKVVRSRSDSMVALFYKWFNKTPVGNKYLCVVVKDSDEYPFIITAYFTDTIKQGEILYG